ncbi:MAG TPA: methyltransferase [Polyangiaceae bacterium]|nr:methyltransferase [Polyangiaceae bacterium]
MPNFEPVRAYFDERIRAHGASPRGSDWNSSAAQEARFDQLLRVVNKPGEFSLLDYGCGYGGLADYLETQGHSADYVGYDLLESAIATAHEHHRGKPRRTFTSDATRLAPVDYVVASGIFNFRGAESFESWTEYVVQVLGEMNRLSRGGFASNFLTKYSDADRMRSDLYYADPMYLFDHCKRHFAKDVALLHDYSLYDFTLIVRKPL